MSYDDGRILVTGLSVVEKLLSLGIFEVDLSLDGDSLYAIDPNPRDIRNRLTIHNGRNMAT
jgi:hypothetical protein